MCANEKSTKPQGVGSLEIPVMHNEWLSFNHYRTIIFVKFNLKSINYIFSQRFYYSHLGKENPCSSQVKVHKLQDKDKYQSIEGTVEIYIQGTGQTIYREIITKKVIEETVQGKQQKYIYIYIYREQDKQETREYYKEVIEGTVEIYIYKEQGKQFIQREIYKEVIEGPIQTIYRGNTTNNLQREQYKGTVEIFKQGTGQTIYVGNKQYT